MKITRRDMIMSCVAGTALWAANGTLPSLAGPGAKAKIPVGLEMWSVRMLCDKDLPGVLAAVGKMGYDAVELAHSYYNHDAASWRKLLDDNGLKACGMHTSLPKLGGDEFQRTVDFQKAIGNHTLIIASLPKKNSASLQALRDTGKQFNELAAKLKEHDLRLGYHCHSGDFKPLDGQLPWEVFGASTAPEVIMQLDTANCLETGTDPVAMLRKFPGRTVSIHLKDHGKGSGVIGEGSVKFSDVFDLCESTGGTQWYVIEEESGGPDKALDNVRRSRENLRKMGR